MKGFALLEILITLVILSIGLLAIAGMQLSALRHSQDAYLHSLATTQLQSLLERLRVNSSDAKRTAELTEWNTINARLLPQGTGDYTCNDHVCTASIQWYNQTQHSLSLSSRLP